MAIRDEQSWGLWDAVCEEASPRFHTANPALGLMEREGQGQLYFPLTSHSCPYGSLPHFPRAWFLPQGRAHLLPPSQPRGIQFRVTYHLGIPGDLLLPWRAQGFVRLVFPLFGALREFWGRAAEFSGEVTFRGRPSRSHARTAVTHNLLLRTPSNVQNLLTYFPIEAEVTSLAGSRPDVTLIGASLQWWDTRMIESNSTTRAPLSISHQELQRVLTLPDIPSSVLRWQNDT